MNFSETVTDLKKRLAPVYGEGEAKAMVRLIFHHLKGWSATDIIVNGDRQVSPYIHSLIERIMKRILNGEPIQYVLGDVRFYGMDFKVNRNVLIPRPETEELVDMIVKENGSSDLRVLDIGTGSGAIAIALSRNLLFPRVTAIDISAEALEVAGENARRLHADIFLREKDIFTYMPPEDSYDIIVSNPPYIPEEEKSGMERNVLDYEPALALFVPDSEPLLYYNRISEVAIRALAPGGKLYLEINPRFADALCEMLQKTGLADVEIFKDISHRQRFIRAEKPKEE